MDKDNLDAACLLEQMDLIPTYYAKCNYCWPVFHDKGAFVHSEICFCDYMVELDCHTLEEAEQIVADMNQKTICPVCGKSKKFTATTNFDMYNERRIISSLNESAANAR